MNATDTITAAGFDRHSHPARYLYELLADHLASLIGSGQLPPRTPLPAEGRLANLCGVSLGTARQATQVLRQRGLVVTVRSKGTYVAQPNEQVGSR